MASVISKFLLLLHVASDRVSKGVSSVLAEHWYYPRDSDMGRLAFHQSHTQLYLRPELMVSFTSNGQIYQLSSDYLIRRPDV